MTKTKKTMIVRGIKYTQTFEPTREFWGTWEARKGGVILYESKTAKQKWRVDHPMKSECMLAGMTPAEVLGKAYGLLMADALKEIIAINHKYGGPNVDLKEVDISKIPV